MAQSAEQGAVPAPKRKRQPSAPKRKPAAAKNGAPAGRSVKAKANSAATRHSHG